jgi:hypothetical protein
VSKRRRWVFWAAISGVDVAVEKVEVRAVLTWQPKRGQQATTGSSVTWHVVVLRADDEGGGGGQIRGATHLGAPCFLSCSLPCSLSPNPSLSLSSNPSFTAIVAVVDICDVAVACYRFCGQRMGDGNWGGGVTHLGTS